MAICWDGLGRPNYTNKGFELGKSSIFFAKSELDWLDPSPTKYFFNFRNI